MGLHVDGHQVQIAHLRRQGDQISVLALKGARLIERLDVRQEEEGEGAEEEQPDAGDILGLTQEPEAGEAAAVDAAQDHAPDTNTEVLYQLLSELPLKTSRIALSLAEDRVAYSDFPDSFDLKGRKLKRKLLEEAGKDRPLDAGTPLSDRHAFIQTDRGALLSITHEDPLSVIGLLDELKPFVGRVQIGLVDPPKIALMNAVRLAYAAEEHVTAIVYVGQDSSRVVFMQNGHYLAFSQPIHEGADSPQVLSTLYSRILFEQDLSNIPDIGRVLLGGACHSREAQPFFAEQFPDIPVDYIQVADLDLSALDEEEEETEQEDASERVSSHAVPIGLAWKLLLPTRAPVYGTNLLPEARRRQQNPFEVAWHGILLLALLLVSFPILGWKAQQLQDEIDSTNFAIELARAQVEQNRPYVELVDDLHVQIQDYRRNLSLIDTLSSVQVVWSEILQAWGPHLKEVGGLWLESFSTSEGDTDIEGDWRGENLPTATDLFIRGRALDRVRVADITTRLGDGEVRSLVRAEIRGRELFDFDLVVPAVSASPADTASMEP